MKRITLALTFLLAVSSMAAAQFAPSKENLRGLAGVRLVVMYGNCPTRDPSNCAKGLDPAQRLEVLKMLEADAIAKLQSAGISVFGLTDPRTSAPGDPKLVVMVTLDALNGFNHPIETELKLLERVRLVRDPSIETDAVIWSRQGVGAPKLKIDVIRSLLTNHLDQFMLDYWSVNPKQSASSGKDKSKETRHPGPAVVR